MTVIKEKVALSFLEIRARLVQLELPEVDLVVGIATGGSIPASLVAYKLNRTLALVRLNYRAENNTPQHLQPLLQAPFQPPEAQRVLLVDDVSVSGRTLGVARALLPHCQITTLVLKGRADVVLFPEIERCVSWPWKVS